LPKFAELLDFLDAQPLLPLPVRDVIWAKIEELTGVRHEVYPFDLNERVTRGLSIRYRDDVDPNKSLAWVAIGKSLNTCWGRLVMTKESMHAFDQVGALSDAPEKFDRLIEELAVEPSPENRSEMHKAEARGFWMALAVLCPARRRAKYGKLLADGSMTPYQVAVKFRIPEAYVPHVFAPSFDRIVEALRKF
jgi:hypothetical protein